MVKPLLTEMVMLTLVADGIPKFKSKPLEPYISIKNITPAGYRCDL
jgi:hypothetical protein